MRGGPKHLEFIKSCVLILTCLYFSHLQSTVHSIQHTYWDIFSTAQNSFELVILMPFSASAFFCFTSSTSAKHFPLRTFFIWGNKLKKSQLGWDQVSRRGGAWGSGRFWSITTEHSVWCGQVLIHHQHKMGKWIERVLKKNALKLNAASHNHAGWSTDTDGFLEHSPSGRSLDSKGPALQKIILVVFSPPLYTYILYMYITCVTTYVCVYICIHIK